MLSVLLYCLVGYLIVCYIWGAYVALRLYRISHKRDQRHAAARLAGDVATPSETREASDGTPETKVAA